VELTVAFDEYLIDAQTRKTQKYQDLLMDIQKHTFKTSLFTVEVGSRGSISSTFDSVLQDFTTATRAQRSQLTKDILRKVLCTSFAIWMKRNTFDWLLI
jgi:hypothetical protein